MNATDKYFEFLKKLDNETPDSIMTNLFGKEWKEKLQSIRGKVDLSDGGFSWWHNWNKLDPILSPIIAKDPIASAYYFYYLVRDKQEEEAIKFLNMSIQTIKTNSWACYVLTATDNAIVNKHHSELLKIIANDPFSSYYYAHASFSKTRDSRFELGEPTILKNGYLAYYYARFILKSRWEEAEEFIAKETRRVDNLVVPMQYINFLSEKLSASDFRNDEFLEMAEPTISQHGPSSLSYAKIKAKFSMKPNFPKGEEAIAKNKDLSFEYSKLINQKFELGEEAISKDTKLSFLYARDILCGRFELGEPAIMDDPDIMLQYAVEVIKGKLPDDMHNRMIGKKLAA